MAAAALPSSDPSSVNPGAPLPPSAIPPEGGGQPGVEPPGAAVGCIEKTPTKGSKAAEMQHVMVCCSCGSSAKA